MTRTTKVPTALLIAAFALTLNACGTTPRDEPTPTETLAIEWCAATIPDPTPDQQTCDTVTLTYLAND